MHAPQQSVLATSKAESEHLCLRSAALEGLGIVALLRELQERVSVRLLCGTSSARPLAQRGGLGRPERVDGKLLWLQGFAKPKKLTLAPSLMNHHAAGVGTKPLAAERLTYLILEIGQIYENDAEHGVVDMLKQVDEFGLICEALSLEEDEVRMHGVAGCQQKLVLQW